MNDQSIAVTLLVTAVLEELEIAYVIGGSLASALHGVARATLDSDLVADIELNDDYLHRMARLLGVRNLLELARNQADPGELP